MWNTIAWVAIGSAAVASLMELIKFKVMNDQATMNRAIVTGNIVENAHIMNNDSDDCVIENNIGVVL